MTKHGTQFVENKKFIWTNNANYILYATTVFCEVDGNGEINYTKIEIINYMSKL